jgi:hypothetical protein
MLTPIRAIVAAHVRRSAVHGKVIGGDDVLADEVAERDALLDDLSLRRLGCGQRNFSIVVRTLS